MFTQTISSADTWERYADELCAPLQLRWVYGDIAQLLGRKIYRNVIIHEDKLVGLFQAVERRLFGIRFQLMNRIHLSEEHDFAKLRNEIKVSLPPGVRLLTTRMPKQRFAIFPSQHFASVNLKQNRDHLRQALHGKWRNALCKAEKSHLQVSYQKATAQNMRCLLLSEKDMQKERGYKALPPEYALAVLKVAPQSLRLFSCLDAQALFFHHGNSVTYLFAKYGPQARAMNAGNLILWRACLHYQDKGAQMLDLGSYNDAKAPDLARFKRRIGADTEEINGCFFF